MTIFVPLIYVLHPNNQFFGKKYFSAKCFVLLNCYGIEDRSIHIYLTNFKFMSPL